MGIDPLNFADAPGILAQRLVRTLCKSCKELYQPTKEEYDEIVESYGEEAFAKLKIPYSNNFKLYRPKVATCATEPATEEEWAFMSWW